MAVIVQRQGVGGAAPAVGGFLAADRPPRLSLNSNAAYRTLTADQVMNIANPLDSDDQIERGDLKVTAEELAATLRRLSDGSIREIDQLINQLQKLRTRLKSAGDRIQGEIAGYAELSQQTMQLTSIIVDTVRKLPPGASR